MILSTNQKKKLIGQTTTYVQAIVNYTSLFPPHLQNRSQWQFDVWVRTILQRRCSCWMQAIPFQAVVLNCLDMYNKVKEIQNLISSLIICIRDMLCNDFCDSIDISDPVLSVSVISISFGIYRTVVMLINMSFGVNYNALSGS